MKKVNWQMFMGSSSTEEAIMLFAGGEYSFAQFSKECWPAECKSAIKILKTRGYLKSRRSARVAIKNYIGQTDMDIKDFCYYHKGPPSARRAR